MNEVVQHKILQVRKFIGTVKLIHNQSVFNSHTITGCGFFSTENGIPPTIDLDPAFIFTGSCDITHCKKNIYHAYVTYTIDSKGPHKIVRTHLRPSYTGS